MACFWCQLIYTETEDAQSKWLHLFDHRLPEGPFLIAVIVLQSFPLGSTCELINYLVKPEWVFFSGKIKKMETSFLTLLSTDCSRKETLSKVV